MLWSVIKLFNDLFQSAFASFRDIGHILQFWSTTTIHCGKSIFTVIGRPFMFHHSCPLPSLSPFPLNSLHSAEHTAMASQQPLPTGNRRTSEAPRGKKSVANWKTQKVAYVCQNLNRVAQQLVWIHLIQTLFNNNTGLIECR